MTAKKKKQLTLVDEAKQLRFICTKCLLELTPSISKISVMDEQMPPEDDIRVLIYIKCHDTWLFSITKGEIHDLAEQNTDVIVNKLSLADGRQEVNGIYYDELSKYSETIERLSVEMMQEFELIQTALKDGHADQILEFYSVD
jgi:hypothetical protein